MGLFSKTRTKRIVPAERTYANAMMVREAARRLGGVESRGDQLARQMRRGSALRDVELARRGAMRDVGEMGIEGPGMYNRAVRTGEGALGQLIHEENVANMERRAGAVPILGTLLRENQPYTKTRKKTGFMEKAAPYMKLGASITGDPYGFEKKAAKDMETDFQSQRGGTYGGTGGAQTSGGPPMASVQSDPPISSGGPPMASVQKDKPTTGTSGGPPMASMQGDNQMLGGMMKKKGGLFNLMKMFGQFSGSMGGGR